MVLFASWNTSFPRAKWILERKSASASALKSIWSPVNHISEESCQVHNFMQIGDALTHAGAFCRCDYPSQLRRICKKCSENTRTFTLKNLWLHMKFCIMQSTVSKQWDGHITSSFQKIKLIFLKSVVKWSLGWILNASDLLHGMRSLKVKCVVCLPCRLLAATAESKQAGKL